MFSPCKLWNNCKNYIYKNYGENPGTMLVHTGVIGWILSSAAQVAAVLFNDKISPEQKVFLIPQECADAAVNILSFYTFTNGVKYIGSKLTKTAKLRTEKLTELLKQSGHVLEKGQKRVDGKVYAGDWNFDITKLPNYKSDIADTFKPFRNGAEVITGLIGSVISSNLITPLARNKYAAIKQKEALGTVDKPENNNKNIPLQKSMSILDYQKIASLKYHSNSSLKI